MRQIYFILFLFFLSAFANTVLAQCSMISLTAEEKSSQADVVFDGKVLAKKCFYDTFGNISTSNTIQVTETKSGNEVAHIIEVITPGGVMEDKAQIHFPGLNLQVGEQGTFYCTEKSNKYFPVALSQGFVPFEVVEQKSSAVQIETITPLTITGGTQDEITINGTGFGNIQGSGTVSFRNADNGGAGWVTIPLGSHYTLWTNTMIKMLIPTYTQSGATVAGSGNIKVTTSSGESVQSPQQLNIRYALSELVYNSQIGKISLAAVDNSGGYILKMSSLFSQNTEAKDALKRAMTTWRCNTGVNVSLDSVNYLHGITSYSDGYGSISFDEQGLLPAGALATTVISLSSCNNEGLINWQLSEVDIIFGSSALWHTGSGQPYANHFDFESVALHELGHMHLEQHNNNTSSVMYYRLNSGESKRNLFNDSGLDGGIEVMQNSINPGYSCSSFENIVPLHGNNCSLVGIDDNQKTTENSVTVFPNPSQGNFTLNWNDFTKGAIQINIHNQLGELVLLRRFINQNSASFNLPLAAGMYFIELSGDEKVITRKISIQ
jgi:hypothetical protein